MLNQLRLQLLHYYEFFQVNLPEIERLFDHQYLFGSILINNYVILKWVFANFFHSPFTDLIIFSTSSTSVSISSTLRLVRRNAVVTSFFCELFIINSPRSIPK